VKLYAFDGADASLDLLPLAARRALDLAGCKLSLHGFRSLSMPERHELVSLGSEDVVDVARVTAIALAATPAAERVAPRLDPLPNAPPEELLTALGASTPLPAASWSALTPLDRYALVKVATGRSPERLGPAYAEIIGQSAFSSHVSPRGGVRMVAVGGKEPTSRRAEAESRVTMNVDAFERVASASAPKGDVLGTARVAAIMAAKRTAELIPLCHPLSLTKVDVRLSLELQARAVLVEVAVECFDRTGVEMEALTAASVAALTVYDMLKAFDRGMVIGPTRLLHKSGGRTGDYRA
jgi:cyclic pyranopterin monophosphate synthase